MKKISRLFIYAIVFTFLNNSTAFASSATEKDIIGNWEVAVFIDGELLITRVELNKENKVSIKQKEFMEHLGYEITWNSEKRTILAGNETDRLTIYIDEHKCDKNGSFMYVKEPAFISDGYAYLPQHFIEVIFGIKTVSVDLLEVSNRVDEVKMISDTRTYEEIQASTDNGSQPWRLNPEDVARQFASDILGLKGSAVLLGNPEKEYARVQFTKQDGVQIHMDLYQPVVKGKYGIWEVESWFDENNRHYQNRDLSKMPPIFHSDEDIPENIKKAVGGAITGEWTDVFGKYYKVLGFEATNVAYTKTEGNAEVKFTMTMVTQNFYKDPDTVGYIKEAREKGSIHYGQLYDEYNMAKKGNFELLVTMETTPGGEVRPDTLKIFGNISPVGEEYVPVRAEDFVIK